MLVAWGLLRERPTIPQVTGAALIVGGVLAAAGAAAWWITGASTTNEPRVDVVSLREGGMLRLRGAF